ncbi:hypothetical protein KUH32_05455 [Thalassococcus sp. CAU 1522]|uniref:Uncharacterized protein n=1 Tax=Thalassococcus arenae TaxID=2851652 RepID=A0ABS6N5A6_9RHOB|nr:hypothetical protein [Thalassococcus arenae]MBV2359208.1 hypothetical protein [Thalassococcus arenae]
MELVMRTTLYAAIFGLSAGAAMAYPTIDLPDLTFPEPSGPVVTQDCTQIQGNPAGCR